jgi:hypothetical protein
MATPSTRLPPIPSSSTIPRPIRIQPPSASEIRNFTDLPNSPGGVGGGRWSGKSFDLPGLLNLPGEEHLAPMIQQMTRSMKEANRTQSHFVCWVIIKHRRIHKLLTDRKKLAIQQHPIIPRRENPTHLRRGRSSIRLGEAVPPEDARNQYQVPLDETFLRTTATMEHA